MPPNPLAQRRQGRQQQQQPAEIPQPWALSSVGTRTPGACGAAATGATAKSVGLAAFHFYQLPVDGLEVEPPVALHHAHGTDNLREIVDRSVRDRDPVPCAGRALLLPRLQRFEHIAFFHAVRRSYALSQRQQQMPLAGCTNTRIDECR